MRRWRLDRLFETPDGVVGMLSTLHGPILYTKELDPLLAGTYRVKREGTQFIIPGVQLGRSLGVVHDQETGSRTHEALQTSSAHKLLVNFMGRDDLMEITVDHGPER